MLLTDVEVRILGCLIEKATTTPDNYPLSLNALTNACNQSSNRDPVMALSEDAVKWAVNSLRQQSLVRAIQPADSRVMKFQHLVAEKLELDAAGRAVLCVLMLRGPQTLAEIRTRTARLADFESATGVDDAVNALAGRDLVAELPRQPGQKEVRYAQLLSGPPHAAPRSDVDPRDAASPRASDSAAPKRSRDTETGGDRVAALEQTVDDLRCETDELRARFEEFRQQFG